MQVSVEDRGAVIVTGAASGIGKAVGAALAPDWKGIALFDINATALDAEAEALSALGVEAMPVTIDLSDAGAIAPAIAVVREQLGAIGGLVSNAGIIQLKPLADTSVADFDLTFAINLRAAFLLMQLVAPEMVARKYGRIVTMSSAAAKTGGSGNLGVYPPTKAALTCLTKAYARDLAPHGVRVNSVSPAFIETPMIKNLSHLVTQIPMGRLGRPEEVGDAVAYLMSDRAGFITGEDLDINGGFLMD